MTNEFKDSHITTGNYSPVTIVQAAAGSSVTFRGTSGPYRPPLQRPPRAEHFTGRQAELERLLADLKPDQGITLTGPAGVGKTALAVEAIWRLAPGDQPPEIFPDGIFFHSFNNQSRAEVALEAIALAFGEEPRPTPGEAAQRALARRAALLVLDGAEVCDDLASVLAARGRCGVLVTSGSRRDAVSGFMDIPPLPLEQALSLLQAWAGDGNVDLSAGRQICALAGGLPLAVRLVGRYLGETGEDPLAYLEWLQASPLQALDLGKRELESVPLLFEHSLSQLSETARQVLGVAGLLAFASFSREAVSAALELRVGDLVRALGELVNYGLLLRQEDKRLVCSHALVHTYACQRQAPEPIVTARLAAYFNNLAVEQNKASLEGYLRLEAERPHLLVIQKACLVRKEWGHVKNIAWVADEFLFLRGHWTERISLLEAGSTAAQSEGDGRARAEFLNRLGTAYAALGKAHQALEKYDRGLVIAREAGDRAVEGAILGNMGNAWTNLGEMRKAIGYYEQALAIDRESGDQKTEGIHLGNLALTENHLGNTRKALELFEQALGIARQVGDRRNEGLWLGNMAGSYRVLGKPQAAIELYEQALEIARLIGDRRSEGVWQGGLGDVYLDLNETDRAIVFFGQALSIVQEIGDRMAESSLLGNLGNAYKDIGDQQKAIDLFTRALSIAQEIGDRQIECAILGILGGVYAALGNMGKAVDLYNQALNIAREIGERKVEGTHLGNLGLVFASLGKKMEAFQAYQQALEIAREVGDRRSEGSWLGNLGNLFHDAGEDRWAVEYIGRALSIAQEVGARRTVCIWLGNLGNAYRGLGENQKAIEHYTQAINIAREFKYRSDEGNCLGNLGSVYSDLGEHHQALGFYEQALTIAVEGGERDSQGIWLANIGLAHKGLDEPDLARQCWRQALVIFQELGDPKEAAVKKWLEESGN